MSRAVDRLTSIGRMRIKVSLKLISSGAVNGFERVVKLISLFG